MTSTSERTHLTRLDAVRGVAILAVFFYHLLGLAYGQSVFPWRGLWRANFAASPDGVYYCFSIFTVGWTGVSLFFVLSGFVIHLSFLNSKGQDAGSFYLRRFWRICPPYLICLAVTAVWYRVTFASHEGTVQLLSHVFLVHNLHPQTFFGIAAPFWSLATEAQFYLAYPLLLALRARLGMGRAMAVIFTVGVLTRLVGFVVQDWNHDPLLNIWMSALALWFDWTLGAYMAERYWNGRTAFRRHGTLCAISIAAFLACLSYKPFDSAASFTMASIVSAIAMDWYLSRRRAMGRAGRLLVPLGLCSYSFYLWHAQLLAAVVRVLVRLRLPVGAAILTLLGGAVGFIGVFAVSWLLYVAIEKPSNRIGKRMSDWWKARRQPATLPTLVSGD